MHKGQEGHRSWGDSEYDKQVRIRVTELLGLFHLQEQDRRELLHPHLSITVLQSRDAEYACMQAGSTCWEHISCSLPLRRPCKDVMVKYFVHVVHKGPCVSSIIQHYIDQRPYMQNLCQFNQGCVIVAYGLLACNL